MYALPYSPKIENLVLPYQHNKDVLSMKVLQEFNGLKNVTLCVFRVKLAALLCNTICSNNLSFND